MNEFSLQSYNHLFAFRFQLGLRNYKTPTDHMRSAILMRKISSKYAKFNITTFHEYYPFADQVILINEQNLKLLYFFQVNKSQ